MARCRSTLVKIGRLLSAAIIATTIAGCSATKHVPPGRKLIDNVKIKITDNPAIDNHELVSYLRQVPNHEVFGVVKLQLATYNLSGSDTTRWFNRWVRSLGQAPIIHDPKLTEQSRKQMLQALLNRGYMNASVEVDTISKSHNRKIDITYRITTGQPHLIATYTLNIPDDSIRQLIDNSNFSLINSPGDPFNRNKLEEERVKITEQLRNNGYYSFSKEYITFLADTAADSRLVNLTLELKPPIKSNTSAATLSAATHTRYKVRNVIYVTDYNPSEVYKDYDFHASDTTVFRGLTILYGYDHYLRPATLYDACYITPGQLYRDWEVSRTYEALGRLGILKYVNIDLRPVGNSDNTEWLDAYILLTRSRKQGVSVEVEGTNSEGDLGFGLGLNYSHRNLARGSEELAIKLRANYESLSSDLSGFINNRYMEYAGEVGVTFPELEAPFLSTNFKRRILAKTELAATFNYQERPEYTRIIAGAGWKYRWNNRDNTRRQRLDMLDINYVYLPNSTLDFINQIAPDNPLLRYSYEDHFIMRMGYGFYNTDKKSAASLGRSRLQPSFYTFRANGELAGNTLYALSWALDQRKDDGAYKLFGIQYAQYVKCDADYTYTINFDQRNSLSLHAGGGIGVPYGNSSMLPFEKRFYAGGANSVRGWGVRTLGPGSYDARNSVTDFINQCGDIRLDLNMEYRARLFWVLEGALFIDAGNIWTIREYENQPGGAFKLDSFYKQIAMAYGAGMRLDFSYFLLRLDLGMKAYNPAHNQERFPLIHPNWNRDATFHFSVGYPF